MGATGCRGVRQSSNRLERNGDARGVVRSRKDDETSARSQKSSDLAWIDGEAIVRAPVESVNDGAHQPAGADQRVVRRPLDQHLVARGKQRRRRDEVRSGATSGRNNAIRRHAVVPGDGRDDRCIPVVIGCRKVERFSCARQIVHRTVEQVAAGQIDQGRAARLCPEQVRRKWNVDHGVPAGWFDWRRDVHHLKR